MKKFNKRKSVIFGIIAFSISIPIFVIIGKTSSIFSIDTNQTLYSSSAPSTIVKNRFNENDFKSPVANADLKDEKIDNNKSKADIIIDEKEEENQNKTSDEKNEQSQNSSSQQINSNSNSQSQELSADLKVLVQLALRNYSNAVSNQIKEVTQKIAQFEQEIKDINEQFSDENFKKQKIWNEVDWYNLKRQKLNTFIGANAPEYQKKRYEAELEVLKKLKKTSLTNEEIKLLKQGMIPSETSPYVWGYLDESKNPVLNSMKEKNKKRFFNTPGWATRSPNGISNGEYEGWTKNDVSSQFSDIFKEAGLGESNNSIQVFEYTPNDKNELKDSKTPSKVISLNADDDKAFQKFSEILKKAVAKDAKIEGVVLKNVGSTHSLQNISSILSILPSSIKKLTLFLDNFNATTGLRGLENHKLQELELYSNINTLNGSWAINPNALKNVDYISFDYNNAATFDTNSGEKIPGSIIFNTLRWDKGDDINKVNEGLSIVFDSKINQRIFQGSFGGKGGYPVNLDFSSTDIKSLKGIDFNKLDQAFDSQIKNWKEDPFAKENYKGFKKIKFKSLSFSSNKNSTGTSTKSYVASIDDFENAQFTDRLTLDEPNGARIFIKDNNTELSLIPFYLTGSTLKGDSLEQIVTFVNAANNPNRTFDNIYVESEEIKNKLSEKIKDISIQVKKVSDQSSNSNVLVA